MADQNYLGGIIGALEDPHILKAMAQVGTELDPEGAGGMLGRPAVSLIERQAAMDEAAKSEAEQKQMMDFLIAELGTDSNITGIEFNEDGGLKQIKGAAGQKSKSELESMSTPGYNNPIDSALDKLLMDFK